MALTVTQKKEALLDFTRRVFTEAGQIATVDTLDLDTAAGELASFIETNTVAINAVLSEPFKSTATTAQKRHLISVVTAQLSGI